jgi:hypothetical protein
MLGRIGIPRGRYSLPESICADTLPLRLMTPFRVDGQAQKRNYPAPNALITADNCFGRGLFFKRGGGETQFNGRLPATWRNSTCHRGTLEQYVVEYFFKAVDAHAVKMAVIECRFSNQVYVSRC